MRTISMVLCVLAVACGGGSNPSPPGPGPLPVAPRLVAPAAATFGTSHGASVGSPAAGVTYGWTIAGGIFAGGGTTASGAAVTFTAGNGASLRLTCAATNAAGTGPAAAADVSLYAAP